MKASERKNMLAASENAQQAIRAMGRVLRFNCHPSVKVLAEDIYSKLVDVDTVISRVINAR